MPRPRHVARRPAFGYVDFGVAHGLSREALLSAAGLDEALRGDPDARVPMFTYMILWRELLVGAAGRRGPGRGGARARPRGARRHRRRS